MLLFIGLRFFDVADILLVAALLYGLYHLLRGTVAINIFLGIVAIFLIWKTVSALQMELFSEILGAFISVGFIALIIIFQPEIRQFLLALGTPRFIKKYQHHFNFLGFSFKDDMDEQIETIVAACKALSKKRMGALIVITRKNKLYQYVQSGVRLNADLSQALLENLFFKNSPLHDGAVIITHDKVVAAGCILPVTKLTNLPGRPGLRHRAGLGVTEQSDAISIIVSEETGKISLGLDGELIAIRTYASLKRNLEKELGKHFESVEREDHEDTAST